MGLSQGGEKMASIIKKLNKQTGVTYVYESESYWDKEKKQPRSRRKLIGKIDDTTGEIIPTGGRGARKKKNPAVLSTDVPVDRELTVLCQEQAQQLHQNETEILSLKKQILELTLTVKEYQRRLSKIEELSKVCHKGGTAYGEKE